MQWWVIWTLSGHREHWFSNLGLHQKHLETPLKMNAGSTPELLIHRVGLQSQVGLDNLHI